LQSRPWGPAFTPVCRSVTLTDSGLTTLAKIREEKKKKYSEYYYVNAADKLNTIRVLGHTPC